MSKGSFVLRAAVGGIMLGHGLQKLKGYWDGPGMEGTEQMAQSLGLHPAKQQAMAVALSETVGGGLTAAGLLSPLGPAMIMGVHAIAIYKVHMKNGFWSSKGGYEFNLLLTAASFTIAAQGPGPLSLDALMRKRRSGLHWGVLAAGLAAGAAAGTLQLAEKFAPGEGTEQQSGTGYAAEAGVDEDLASGGSPKPASEGAVPSGEDFDDLSMADGYGDQPVIIDDGV